MPTGNISEILQGGFEAAPAVLSAFDPFPLGLPLVRCCTGCVVQSARECNGYDGCLLISLQTLGKCISPRP